MRMSEALLSWWLRWLVRKGALVLHHADGRVERYGEANVRAVVVHLLDRGVPRKLIINPSMGLGEAYMDGRLSVEGDDLHGLLEVVLLNLAARHTAWPDRAARWLRRIGRWIAQFNPEGRARRNVSHHYDLSDGIYDLFLDADRQYSCAYFRQPTDSLECAQAAKKQLIATKLLLKPGQRVLDVGCGWGGLALYLARTHGVQVTGVTLSREQHRFAEARARAAGVAHQARFQLADYREVTGTFDRVVSVGMFEHVGVPHYQEFFAQVRDRLADDGVALIHTIGRADGPAATDPWIAKYIFPGGAMPALSEIAPVIERAGLILTDLEVWRLHYATTVRAWRARFDANRERIERIYDARFCRMWAFYLSVSELAFRHGGLVVFQFQLAKRQQDVPLTRDYLAPGEASTHLLEQTA